MCEKGKKLVEEVDKWVIEREKGLRDENGWLTLVGLLWVKEGKSTLGSAPTCDLVIESPHAANDLGVVELQGGVLYYTPPGLGAPVTHNGEPVTTRTEMKSDAQTDSPTTFRAGSVSWFALQRGDNWALRVKDSKSKVLQEFTGVDRFPTSLEYRVCAKWEPFATPKEVKVPTAIGSEAGEAKGQFVFHLAGEECRLTAVGGAPEKRTMLVFADATSGNLTYGGGRFLWVDPVDSEQEMAVLDFNRAYNPPCIFTPFATCPRPLPENRLKVAINAGERTWPEGEE
mmetsp:Transcript_13194/g.37450  ORF Transcript_13194/g.37450 Transcript_13194/m.37450 type:complete len:285 (-) Transcript_13194:18-872(-)|eukprot:CAMPEP_0119133000 /NCGR_PEP_ID=MMETSP1310-20130426/12765_1 /TAXON_ID=464262 /ORGANISM="Genus nov. species nov., Strain RCC2339" /LENGTH=284 /DNA_ID=CAMNT_0007123669 /DNA_START=134 /DNA_END=988 /DNA_ORIENTATION=-